MAYIESHQELRHSPKVSRGARLLQIHKAQFIGHLHMLWWWAVDHALDGDLSAFDHLDLADAAEWEGDPSKFVETLIECGPGGKSGFIDRVGGESGGMRLHDWHTYVDALQSSREASVKGNHKRWHLAQGRVSPDCELCQESQNSRNPEDSVPLVPPDIPPDSPGISHPLPPGHPPTEPTYLTKPQTPSSTVVDLDGGEIDADDPPTEPPASEPDDALRTFEEHFWPAYPSRNGKKIGKGKALTQWRKLTIEQRRRAFCGAQNLAASDQIAKDAHRFLRRDTAGEFPFDDWQTAATSEHDGPAQVPRCVECGQPSSSHDSETHDHIVNLGAA